MIFISFYVTYRGFPCNPILTNHPTKGVLRQVPCKQNSPKLMALLMLVILLKGCFLTGYAIFCLYQANQQRLVAIIHPVVALDISSYPDRRQSEAICFLFKSTGEFSLFE